MSEFDEREKSFERKFELDEELEFKAAVRAAYLFGQWAATQMGLKTTDAENYARQMVDMIIAKPGHDQIIAKAEKDLKAKHPEITRHRLEKEYGICQTAAVEQVKAGR